MSITKLFPTLFLTLLLTLIHGVSMALVTPKNVPLETPVTAYRLDDERLVLTIALEMEEEWYTYANDPGGIGKPTILSGTAANGVKLTPVYPTGIRKPDSFDPSIMINAYKDGTLLYAIINAPSDMAFPIDLRLELLLCHPTRCIPVRKDMAFGDTAMAMDALPLASEQEWWAEFTALHESKAQSTTTSTEVDSTQGDYTEWNFTPQYLQPGLEVSGLLSAILMGLLAGFILNIMPCVLPVISLKLSALLNSSTIENEADRIHAFREHNLFFILGVLSFFMLLALVLGATGEAWGALFQKQWLVIIVAIVILALSLSLFGFFHLPIIDLKFDAHTSNPRLQAYFTGNLTTLLATPCSGPFLGGVLSWSLIQGPLIIFTIFASIGVGMSLPYILLTIRPSLSRYLPKSGPWIVYVEKGVAFFLVGTAFYLFSLAFGSESMRLFAALWGIILLGWIWRQTLNIAPKRRWVGRMIGIAILGALVFWTTPKTYDQVVWEKFQPQDLKQRIGQERLFVDFTADWCPTCKALEATVLTPENIVRWKREYDMAFIKVDLTERNVEGDALLRSLGSMSIPVAAIFSPGPDSHSPLVLRDLFTQSQLENVLESWKK